MSMTLDRRPCLVLASAILRPARLRVGTTLWSRSPTPHCRSRFSACSTSSRCSKRRPSSKGSCARPGTAHPRRRPRLRILLSGSPFRTMEAIQEERSPLFGRVDLALLVEPFSPHEAALLLPRLSAAEHARLGSRRRHRRSISTGLGRDPSGRGVQLRTRGGRLERTSTVSERRGRSQPNALEIAETAAPRSNG